MLSNLNTVDDNIYVILHRVPNTALTAITGTAHEWTCCVYQKKRVRARLTTTRTWAGRGGGWSRFRILDSAICEGFKPPASTIILALDTPIKNWYITHHDDRNVEPVEAGERAMALVGMAEGKRLTFKQPASVS